LLLFQHKKHFPFFYLQTKLGNKNIQIKIKSGSLNYLFYYWIKSHLLSHFTKLFAPTLKHSIDEEMSSQSEQQPKLEKKGIMDPGAILKPVKKTSEGVDDGSRPIAASPTTPKKTPMIATKKKKGGPKVATSSKKDTKKVKKEADESTTTTKTMEIEEEKSTEKIIEKRRAPVNYVRSAVSKMTKEQRNKKAIIQKAPLARDMHQKITECGESFRVTHEAVIVTRKALDAYISGLSRDANVLAFHAGRMTVKPKDLKTLSVLVHT
jgi:histone H3/H4